MYRRFPVLDALIAKKSLFLLGPRQTGKSTYLRERFPDAVYLNLLEADTFRQLSARPETLRQSLRPQDKLIIVDEVQKLPELLDEVQLMIDRDRTLRWILTGSSARKLKHGKANLLGGRAWTAHFHSLCAPELDFGELNRRLSYGSLPGVLTSSDPREELKAYIGTYLREEIQAEALTRNIGRFGRFLEVAALANGEQVNFATIGSDVGMPARTVKDHFDILSDTLVAELLPPFGLTRKRKAVATPKLYFFDVGVAHALRRQGVVEPGSPEYGRALEHMIYTELRTFIDYRRRDEELTFWRSQSGFEVDFLLGDSHAIEVKAKERVTEADLKGLRALREDLPKLRCQVVSLERKARVTDDGIEILGVEAFLRGLWAG